MKKNDLSLILAVVALAIPLGTTALAVGIAFFLGMVLRPWVLSFFTD